nr:uncharacterized protein LOC108077599 [Drosophila kikkawai]
MWWQKKPPADGITSCNAPSLLHSVATLSATAGAAPKTATAAIKKGALAAPALPAATLANDVYQCAASRPANKASTCSNQPPKPRPESKPESSYPEWECRQGMKQHELPKPEVPKRQAVTLTTSEMEAVKLRWGEY